jgi:hypothetical protein
MDETYRMLGREHEADLEREALSRRRAAEARGDAGLEDHPRQYSLRQRIHDHAPRVIRRAACTLLLGSRTTPAERPATGD